MWKQIVIVITSIINYYCIYHILLHNKFPPKISSKNAAEICKSDETFKDWQAALISEDNESKYFFNFCPMIHRL